MLSYEYNQRYVGDPADPGVTDQLGIKRKKAFGLHRVAAGRSLPVHQARATVDLPDRVHIRNEFIVSRECASHLDLEVLLGPWDTNTILSGKCFKEMDSLV